VGAVLLGLVLLAIIASALALRDNDGDDGQEVTATPAVRIEDLAVPETTTSTADTTPAPAVLQDFELRGVFRAGSLVLIGTVGGQEAMEKANAAAITVLGPDRVLNELEIDPGFGTTGRVFVNPGPAQIQEMKDALIAVSEAVGGEIIWPEPPDPAVVQKLNETLEADPIQFEVNSATVTPASIDTIDEVARLLADNPDGNLTLEGHTDSTGDDSYNLGLSQRRADSVRILLEQRGVPTERITSIGRGEADLVFVNGVEDRDASRRLVFAFCNDPVGCPASG